MFAARSPIGRGRCRHRRRRPARPSGTPSGATGRRRRLPGSVGPSASRRRARTGRHVGRRTGEAAIRSPSRSSWSGWSGSSSPSSSIGALFAFQQPPFVAPDETAHLGYAHEIADLRLPEIDRAPDIPDWAVQWQAEADSREDDRYRGVWVANHPPLHYVLTAPLIWLAELTDRADGGLLYLRLANVLFAAVGVALTYLLGTELSGGSPAHRPGRGRDRRPRAPGPHRVLAGAQRRPRLRRRHGHRVGRGAVRAARSRPSTELAMLGVAVACGAGAHVRRRCCSVSPWSGSSPPPPRRSASDGARSGASVGGRRRRRAAAGRRRCSAGSTSATSPSTATSARPTTCCACSGVVAEGGVLEMMTRGEMWGQALPAPAVAEHAAPPCPARADDHRHRLRAPGSSPPSSPGGPAIGTTTAGPGSISRPAVGLGAHRGGGDRVDRRPARQRGRQRLPALPVPGPRRARGRRWRSGSTASWRGSCRSCWWG